MFLRDSFQIRITLCLLLCGLNIAKIKKMLKKTHTAEAKEMEKHTKKKWCNSWRRSQRGIETISRLKVFENLFEEGISDKCL